MFLQKMFVPIFHTRRSKFRWWVLVKCYTKEILCTQRLWKIKGNIDHHHICVCIYVCRSEQWQYGGVDGFERRWAGSLAGDARPTELLDRGNSVAKTQHESKEMIHMVLYLLVYQSTERQQPLQVWHVCEKWLMWKHIQLDICNGVRVKRCHVKVCLDNTL